jgi:Trk K+ transport system NAD-binding subunit
MSITKPVVVGMGRVGNLIALLLEELGMQVVGVDMQEVSEVPSNVDFVRADMTDSQVLARLCHGRDALITCLHVSSYPG